MHPERKRLEESGWAGLEGLTLAQGDQGEPAPQGVSHFGLTPVEAQPALQ